MGAREYFWGFKVAIQILRFRLFRSGGSDACPGVDPRCVRLLRGDSRVSRVRLPVIVLLPSLAFFDFVVFAIPAPFGRGVMGTGRSDVINWRAHVLALVISHCGSEAPWLRSPTS